METRSILVTGGAGFMGSWLVDALLDSGHEVISVDNLLGGSRRNVNPDCKFVKADICRRSKVAFLVKGVDIIYHLASYAAEGQSIFSPISINDINLTPINNLLVEAVNNNVGRIVFTSSMAVYGDQTAPFSEELPRRPQDPYGAAKAYSESMLEIFSRNYGLEYVILRPHNVYGPRQNIADPFRNVLCIWMNRIMRGKPPIIFGDGEQSRAFSYVEDITPSVVNAGFYQKATSQIINIGSDEVVTIIDACKFVLAAMESEMQPLYHPGRLGEVKHAYCTIKKSMELLDYRTKYPLSQGLRKTAEWARELGPINPTYEIPLEITKKAPDVWINKLM